MKNYFLTLNHRLDQFLIRRRLMGMKDIATFALLTVIIHYSWNYWDYRHHFFPLSGFIGDMMDLFAEMVLNQSTWMLNTFMGYQIRIEGDIMRFPSGYDVQISGSCGGFKHIVQFVLLIVFYRGKLVHKLWFIPAGVFVVHFINLLRIFIVGLFSMNYPEYMQPVHDEVLRWAFYLLLCLLWLLWVKKVNPRNLSDLQAS